MICFQMVVEPVEIHPEINTCRVKELTHEISARRQYLLPLNAAVESCVGVYANYYDALVTSDLLYILQKKPFTNSRPLQLI